MSFLKDTGEFIPFSTATSMLQNWKATLIETDDLISEKNPKAHGFGADKLLDILNQDNCVGVRFYNGIKGSNNILIVIGVDSDGNDITDGYILGNALSCPDDCPGNSLDDN